MCRRFSSDQVRHDECAVVGQDSSLPMFTPLAGEMLAPLFASSILPVMDDESLSERHETDGGLRVARAQLGIAHVLVWTAGSALILAGFQAVPVSEEMPDALRNFQHVQRVLAALVYGAAVGGALIVMVSRVRPTAQRLEPGHWLIAIAGIWILAVFTRWLLVTSLMDVSTHNLQAVVFNLTETVLLIAAAIVYALVVVTRRDYDGWRVVFALFAIFNMLLIPLHVATAIAVWQMMSPYFWDVAWTAKALFSVLGLLILGIVAGIDVRKERPRDGLHWAGVFTCCAMSTLTLFNWIGVWIFRA